LKKKIGKSLPNVNDEASVPILLDICKQQGIHPSTPHTPARLLDKLVSHFVEPLCIQPTFICDFPKSISPLAKDHPLLPGFTERFELYICGSELCNAYSELSDPREQRNRFAQQQEYKDLGDKESQCKDEGFCVALEYGLPPTSGWGIGIDRLCMLLCGTTNIREVIAFPIKKMHQKTIL